MLYIKDLLTAVVFGVGSLTIAAAAADAADREVVVAYQTDALPSSVAIANGDFAQEKPEYDIDFRKFISGAESLRRHRLR